MFRFIMTSNIYIYIHYIYIIYILLLLSYCIESIANDVYLVLDCMPGNIVKLNWELLYDVGDEIIFPIFIFKYILNTQNIKYVRFP